jgi:hypothetical protein
MLVAAIVTQSGAESSESVRDRAAALDAHIFRVLPRDAHKDPLLSPFVHRSRVPPELPQQRDGTSQSRLIDQAVKG